MGENRTRAAFNGLGKPRRLLSVNVSQADMFYQSSSALFSSISSFSSRWSADLSVLLGKSEKVKRHVQRVVLLHLGWDNRFAIVQFSLKLQHNGFSDPVVPDIVIARDCRWTECCSQRIKTVRYGNVEYSIKCILSRVHLQWSHLYQLLFVFGCLNGWFVVWCRVTVELRDCYFYVVFC